MVKKLFLAILIILLSKNSLATNWCEHASVSGCWNIEEGLGTTLNDQSSANIDGTFKGAGEPAWSITVPSSANGFDGSSSYSIDGDANDYVNLGDNNDLATGNFSIVFWSYWDVLPGTDLALYIIGKWSASSICNYRIGVDDDSNTDNFRFGFCRATSQYILDSATTVTATTWYHIANVYTDVSSTNAVMYINGVADSNTTDSINTRQNNDNTANLAFVSEDTAGTRAANAKLDEVAMFSIALTSTDVNNIMDYGLIPDSTGYGQIIFIGNE